MIRRINLYGGPGSGKSTLAAKVFSELKMRSYDVEHISEYIKSWAYLGRKAISYNQVYVFGKQMHYEDRLLQSVDHIVTDSPILLNASYGLKNNFVGAKELVSIAHSFDKDYPSINLYVERNVNYVTKGRYHGLEEAKEFDEFLLEFMDTELKDNYITIDIHNFAQIMDIIEESLRK